MVTLKAELPRGCAARLLAKQSFRAGHLQSKAALPGSLAKQGFRAAGLRGSLAKQGFRAAAPPGLLAKQGFRAAAPPGLLFASRKK